MLDNLTKRLVKENIDESNKDLFIKGIIIPTKMSKIERYSLIDKNCDANCDDIKNILSGVTFNDTETLEDRKLKLYNACNSTLNENVSFDKETKMLSMKKEDYEIIKEAIMTYKKAKTENDKKEPAKKIKIFLSTVKSNIKSKKVDDEVPVDSFITASINALCKIFFKDMPVKKDGNTKDLIIAKIYMIDKKI